VDSPMLAELAEKVAAREGTSRQALLQEWARSNAFQRLIKPTEVAHTCAWLISEESSGISGQTIVVDGPVPTGERDQ
ncbi:MAG: SDR family oxidoreductase, partial [Nocardioides sp.]